MRYRRHLAGLAAGVMLAGGIGTVLGSAGLSASHPLAPGAAARLRPADVYLHNPRGASPRAVVVTGGDPGNGNAPKAIIIIGDPGGDGPGPKVRA